MWLYVPNISTSSPCAPEAAGSISASDWRCQALARSAWWRGKPSPSRTWSQRCARVSWMTLLSGAMPEPSTAALGVAALTASLAAFRASPTALPGSASPKRMSATSGARPVASSCSPVPGSSSSRMSAACSPAGGRNAYGETWGDLVLRVRSDCSRRRRSARAMSANASSSSLWLTPDVPNGGRSLGVGVSPTGLKPDGSKAQVGLQNQARTWPTPDACVMNDGEGSETFLARQARQKAKGINGNGMGFPLAMAATMWPTPAARDYKGANSAEHLEKSSGSLHLDQLPNFVQHLWSTPRATDGEKGGPNQMFGAGGIPLPSQTAALSSHLAPMTSPVGESLSSDRRSLNPLFVEWLMGWPPAWTLLVSSAFACSETALSRWRRDMRCALSSLALHDAPAAQVSLFG
jgi:hypothetical protein